MWRGTIRNRLAKYYLRQWAHFDKNFEYLRHVEEIDMKILYSGLKEMDPEERTFLANKYRVTIKPYVVDKTLAKRYGMTLDEYRIKRIALETKLQSKLDAIIPKYQAERKKALDIDYGRVKA